MKIKQYIEDKIRNNLGEYFIDSYLISFPKSGRSWLNLIIYHYIQAQYGQRVAYLCNCSGKMPLPSIPLLRKNCPIIVLTHEPLNNLHNQNSLGYEQLKDIFNPLLYKGKRNIFLIRDPRDVLVSYFYHKTIREPFYCGVDGYKGSIDEFAKSEIFGIKKVVEFLNLWGTVVQKDSNYLIINYENLRSRTKETSSKVIEYLTGRVSDEYLEIAIEKSNMESMRKKEIEELKLTGITKKIDENALKARKGIIGDYKNEFAADTIKYIENYIKTNLDTFYEIYRYKSFMKD